MSKVYIQQNFCTSKLYVCLNNISNSKTEMAVFRKIRSADQLKTKETIHMYTHKLKLKVNDLKIENECLRSCLKAPTPALELDAYSKLKLQDDKRHLQEQIVKLREELKSIETCLVGAGDSNELNQLREKNNKLEEENKELKQKITSFKESITKEDIDIERLNIFHLCNIIKDLKRRNVELDTKLKLVQKIYNESVSCEEQVKKLNEKLKRYIKEKDTLEKQLNLQKKNHNDLMERLEENVTSSNNQKLYFENEITNWKKIVSGLEDNLKNLKSQLTIYKTFNNSSENWQEKIVSLQNDKAHLDSIISNMNRNQNDLTDQLESKIRESTITEVEQQTKILKLESKVRELETLVSNLESKLTIERNKNSLNTDKSNPCESSLEIINLKLDKSTLQEDNEILVEENKKLKQKIFSLKKDFYKLKHEAKKALKETYHECKKISRQSDGSDKYSEEHSNH